MTVAESPPRPRVTTGHDRVEKPHYLPLDSVRGIAALSVVIHHVVISRTVIAAFPHKAWIDVPFFHNAWLFVDLFFVLSGMVISLNYATSDFRDFSLREFVLRRLARIYPLHIVTLVAMLMLRFARLGLVAIGILAVAPIQTEVNTGYSFFLNVLLLHSMGLLDHLSWNGPSWSISTEF
jgi:peptidoglycan/LPS O-acetylase OafA/YrhL